MLVGGRDDENPRGIDAATLLQWQREGVVEWWGHRDDMTAVFSQATIACLPSYREGLPKALLEAAACGLPLVATDVPGCREVVRKARTVCWFRRAMTEALARALGDASGESRETPDLCHGIACIGRARVWGAGNRLAHSCDLCRIRDAAFGSIEPV